MGSKAFETLVGAGVIAVAIIFFVYAYGRADVQAVSGYTLHAQFTSVGGLKPGADVRLAGIKVGTVTDMKLGPGPFYLADVTMSMASNVKLPTDSSASIAAEGLLGGNYISLTPGGADKMLADGGTITDTQPAVDLMSLISRAMFGGVSGGSSSGGSTKGSTSQP